MCEGFDDSGSYDNETASDIPDLPAGDSFNETTDSFEPFDDDFNETQISMDDLNNTESPISECELTNIQNEADALNIEPLDDGIDIGFNYDEAMAELNTMQELSDESSTLDLMTTAAMSNADSPGLLAQIAGSLAIDDPTASEAAAGLAQMGMDAALPAMEGLMDAAHRQHDLIDVPFHLVDDSGEPVPWPGSMIQATDEAGEQIWVRPTDDTAGGAER